MDKIQEQALFFVTNALIVISVLIIGYFTVNILVKLLKQILFKTKLDNTAASFIVSVFRVVMLFIVVITALGTIGVNIASLITALGAAALTAGLALQDCLGNVVSGLVILINKPFKSGDTLDIDGVKGRVQDIKIFTTTIHTLDNKIITIPNSTLTKNKVINCTMSDTRRMDLSYTVSYDSDIEKVRKTILSVVNSNDMILKEPAAKVYVGEHLDNGIQIVVFIHIDPDNYYDVYYYMQENVKLAFDKNDITIPYPHIVVKNNK